MTYHKDRQNRAELSLICGSVKYLIPSVCPDRSDRYQYRNRPICSTPCLWSGKHCAAALKISCSRKSKIPAACSIAQKENTVDKTGSHDGNGHYVRKAGAGYGNGSASDASYGYNAPRVHTHHIFIRRFICDLVVIGRILNLILLIVKQLHPIAVLKFRHRPQLNTVLPILIGKRDGARPQQPLPDRRRGYRSAE